MLIDGFLRFCDDPEITCCRAEAELGRLREENEHLRSELIELQKLVKAKEEGRLVVLPCKIGSIVYTINVKHCPCDICQYGKKYNYDSIECLHNKGTYKECPPPRYSIVEHICEGFEISKNEKDNTVISNPEEFGYEGLETFYGCDGNVYYTRKAAEKALEVVQGRLSK